MTDEAPSTLLQRARTVLDAGRVSECHALIAPLLGDLPDGAQDRTVSNLGARDRTTLAYLQLACALYYTGDLEAARRLNADLPTDLWRPLRYRLSLRLRDPLTAARLRRDPGVTDRERDDFRTTAGLHLLWAGRYDRGFPLYASRHNAILFPRTVPGRLTHAPCPRIRPAMRTPSSWSRAWATCCSTWRISAPKAGTRPRISWGCANTAC